MDLLIGVQDGPVGKAFDDAVSRPQSENPSEQDLTELKVIFQRPRTLLVPTVTVRTKKQARHIYENAVQGIVMAIEASLADGFLPEGALDDLVSDRQWLYYSCMVPALLMTAIAWSITRSRLGRAFVALRDTEIGAQHMGINVPLYVYLAGEGQHGFGRRLRAWRPR